MAPPTASTILYELPSILEPLNLSSLYPKDQPLEIELGSGDGSFILKWSEQNADHNFLAIERLLGRIRKIDRRGQRIGLQNLRAIRVESIYFMQYLLPAGCCAALHIYFPDPWPKRRHQRHRIINPAFPVLAQRVLQENGRVFLRTDNAPYYRQMLEVFSAAPTFRPIETPPELLALKTDFEAEFNSQGIETLRAAYQLSPGVELNRFGWSSGGIVPVAPDAAAPPRPAQ